MKFGQPYGAQSFWGTGTGFTALEFCELVEERVLVQMDDTEGNRNLRDLICDFAKGFGVFVDVARDIELSFDIDTAIGEQLDFIGRVLGLPRRGYLDDRYRVFLKIQRDLILSARRDEANFTGTHNNILQIVRTFIGPGPDPIVLSNYPPYSFVISIPGIAIEELALLVNFLCVAIFAGVLGQSIFILGSNSLWDSDSVGPILDGGIWASASVAIPNSSIWSFTVQIGIQPCE